ncbi:MFS general substrate transporter [Punctularia strigosozonata HHB-11173 SS5]|uniref:MFS general substrate transporter n=1 Tax=Punctularia strigosozonata (strain HHB-11173) TaxID=741275 RepID=R7S4Y8_PUNST|nr:MFS general substrate transporter [Punctularia strigosozonata HHB-11173 SS5]EIN04341.1 MFS general substrate transporter [Punctularia strigosozonata HHB-11173 SS5]
MAQPHHPRLLSTPRLVTFVVSILVALGSGTNYVFSAYAPQLGSRLRISHTQLNIIGLAGNVGVYSTAPIWGRIADLKGPRMLLCIAFVGLLLGYSGIRHIYDAGLPTQADSSTKAALPGLTFWILAFCNFLSGVGGNGGLCSALNVTARNFPDSHRAAATGIVISGFGLSAFFFSTIAHTLFPGNTSDFLLVLALGTSIPMVLGLFFLRYIPLPATTTALEHGPASAEEQESLVIHGPPEVERANSRTRLLSPAAVETEVADEEEVPHVHHQQVSSHFQFPHTRNSVEMSVSPTRDGHRRSASARTRRSRSKSKEIPVKDVDGPNIHGKALAFAPDFWLLFCFMSLLSGTGLMYINNVGSISQALFAQGNPDYDETMASQWQSVQVSAISITNCLGRIVIGFTADFTKYSLQQQRSTCLTLVAALLLVSQLACLAITDVSDLWKASALLGFGYGSMFGLVPTIAIEWFGLPHFSENWGFLSLSPLLGGNLFSLAFGRNLDAHASPGSPSTSQPASLLRRAGLPADAQCFDGRSCYEASLHMTIAACTAALGIAIWLGVRDRRKLRESAASEREVVWAEEN